MITYERQKDGTLKQVDSPPKRAELVEQRIYDRCLVRVGQLEAEKAALEARIDELCAEVERLRGLCGRALTVIENNCSECAYFYDCNIMTDCKCVAPKKIRDELRDMDARPRELARGTCHMEYCDELSGDGLYPTEAYECSACGGVTVDGKPDYCPRCGRKVVE